MFENEDLANILSLFMNEMELLSEMISFNEDKTKQIRENFKEIFNLINKTYNIRDEYNLIYRVGFLLDLILNEYNNEKSLKILYNIFGILHELYEHKGLIIIPDFVGGHDITSFKKEFIDYEFQILNLEFQFYRNHYKNKENYYKFANLIHFASLENLIEAGNRANVQSIQTYDKFALQMDHAIKKTYRKGWL